MGRRLKKIIFILVLPLLRLVDFLSPRIYMVVYNRLLVLMGVNMLGEPRYISTKVKFDDFKRCYFGNRLVISDNVVLLTHDYSYTTALISQGSKPSTDLSRNGDICIGNNVFIGLGSIILPGTKIGDNVIIGAGTIVRGTIKSDSVVIGNPCKVIFSLSELASKWCVSEINDVIVDNS